MPLNPTELGHLSRYIDVCGDWLQSDGDDDEVNDEFLALLDCAFQWLLVAVPQVRVVGLSHEGLFEDAATWTFTLLEGFGAYHSHLAGFEERYPQHVPQDGE